MVPVVPSVWTREGDSRQELEVAGHRESGLNARTPANSRLEHMEIGPDVL
jgi:hypothetical protein